MNWDLHDLVFDYYPRNMWLSHSQAFTYCSITPSQLEVSLASVNKYNKDPNIVYTISPKNYTVNSAQYTDRYLDTKQFEIILDGYGTKVRCVDSKIEPIWVNYVTNNQWYLNQIRATKIAKSLKLLPGVKSVFLTGSSALELASNASDIDFIIQSNPGMVWVSRFWVKVYLKMIRQDVHDIVLENTILFVRLCRYLRLISVEKYNIQITNIENKIWKKKTLGGLVDVGLFFENIEDVEKTFPKESRNFYIWASLQSDKMDAAEDRFDGGVFKYWNNDNMLQNTLMATIRVGLAIVSWLAYPVLSLQYYYYKLRGVDYIYFLNKKDIICYFPIIYKPKSVLEYQINSFLSE
jgi:predicted nucleotidyltransferase